jgi:deoxyribodipyrimidine photolyase-related protein
MSAPDQPVRQLVVVLGDQLDAQSAAFDGFDAGKDRVWMAEAPGEARHVWSAKQRIAYFLAAMRHFARAQLEAGRRVEYHSLEAVPESATLGGLLADSIERLRPQRVVCVQPGEWRVLKELEKACSDSGRALQQRPDRHFHDTPESFREWAQKRKGIRLEHYYREMRRRHGILMTHDGKPEGGDWNYDTDNRGAFGRDGPDGLRRPALRFAPDSTTRAVIDEVTRRFADHPGSLDSFAWPVTRAQALAALEDFITYRLPLFGRYQDAMWSDEPFLYHSLISGPLNLKLLNPREVVDAAVAAWRSGAAPLNAVEGFVRQILGWREYVRGIYWWRMPDYLGQNALEANAPLPQFYWTGETPYNCLRQAIGQTLRHGYAHHIQRLMVTGLYALLLGVDPRALHEWYLAVYIDAVEWVELPNTLGMSQFGDGGLMASKPYVASGKYIHRMSNYCAGCPADPARADGPRACPFTTLYWDFLERHRGRLAGNRRMALQLRNADRRSDRDREATARRAAAVRDDPSGKELFENAT